MSLLHGQTVGGYSPEYRAWGNMKSRCLNPNHPKFPNYGARGISIAPQWMESFSRFLQDVGPRPGPEYSLDRIDNNGNYEPGNVRWATKKQQNRNTNGNRLIEYNGEVKCVAEWAERTGIPYQVIHRRLSLGRPVERVLSPSKIDEEEPPMQPGFRSSLPTPDPTAEPVRRGRPREYEDMYQPSLRMERSVYEQYQAWSGLTGVPINRLLNLGLQGYLRVLENAHGSLDSLLEEEE